MCACMCTQLCWTLYKLMDCNSPGSSVRGISQTRIPERVAISFCRGSSQHREALKPESPALAGGFFTTDPPQAPMNNALLYKYCF